MLNTTEFKSVEALDKAYADHIESLEMWGGEFDRPGLMGAWAEAVADLQEALSAPRWKDDLNL